MTGLRLRSARLAWAWCLAYTVPVRPDLRARRRAELLSHLWEAEAAGVRARRLLSATLRGALHDLSWCCRRGWRYTAGLPETWAVGAAAFPLAAWISSSFLADGMDNRVELPAALGGPLLLAVSGVTWLRGRGG